MKNISRTLLGTAFLFTMIAAPLADAGSEAKADNAPGAVAKGEVVTNNPGNEHESVRIDSTGVHVGGADPVDINVPNWGGRLGPLLPILSVLAVFGSPVAILGLFFYFRHRRNRMFHETLRAMVEKGVPIPPELLSGGATLANGSNLGRRGIHDLRNGLVLIGLGAGVMLLGVNAGFSKLGLIPIFIGLAMIAAWLIGNKIRNKQSPQ